MLEAEEDLSGHDGRALHRTADMRLPQWQVDELHAADGNVLAHGGNGEKLANIRRAVKQHQRPGYAQGVVAAFEREVKRNAVQPVGEAGRTGLRNQLAFGGLAGELEVARGIDRSIFQEDCEGRGDRQFC